MNIVSRCLRKAKREAYNDGVSDEVYRKLYIMKQLEWAVLDWYWYCYVPHLKEDASAVNTHASHLASHARDIIERERARGIELSKGRVTSHAINIQID